jgi:shikimate-5-dehydrogenase
MTARRGAAVLGSPISHSLSPVLHRAAYDALGLTDWSYRAVECDETALADTLDELARDGLAGASLTMPLKRAVMPMLTDIEATARLVGGANTVIFDDAGWRGANTDVAGMHAAMRPAIPDVEPGGTAAVLGAGATAAAAVAALGSFSFDRVEIYARRPEAADPLMDIAGSVELDVAVRSWDDLGRARTAAIVVSTTPADSTQPLIEAIDRLNGVEGVLFDVLYSPWPTPLAATWGAAGGLVIGGLELLIEQAAGQVRLMTGREAPVAVMRDAGYAALRDR